VSNRTIAGGNSDQIQDIPRVLKLHATYRYPKPASLIAEGNEGGIENFFGVTSWPDWPGLSGAGRAQLEKGIDAIRPVHAVDGERRPAILIGTNPLKAGTDWTPWHDEIDPRNGFVRYYGDNKPGLGLPPESTPGNRAVLAEFALHGSNQLTDRLRAAPLLFFENVAQEGRTKGYRRFRGVGLVDRVERVVQVDRHEQPFVNYRYDCTLLTMKSENNSLAWNWIAMRRDPSRSLEESLEFAPVAWGHWVRYGNQALDTVRQQLLTYRILTESEQRPTPQSREAAVLDEVFRYYAGPRKHRFEALAERIAQLALGANGGYRMGWVTKASADRGIDFVARLDLGTDVGPMRVVIAGQAKCQLGGSSPAELSRLASKLSRGWVGVFVTTGYFSQQAQMELQDDGYPILLIDGRHVGELVARECAASGLSTTAYLEQVDATYETRIKARNAAEILSDE
jgi:hypothetical protein